MDQRLQEAARAGDVASLQQLLKEDSLILHRPYTGGTHPPDNPLHVAASLGYSAFAREVLALNPDLARAVNGYRFSPLHLASANGHLTIVTDLLATVGSDLCFIRDKDGLIPVQVAVLNGRVRVVEELVHCAPESIGVMTGRGDSTLHLAVKSNCFEVVKFLVEKVEENDDLELLMAKDGKGNTILHLATARKQFEILKMLLHKSWADINAKNLRGLTILDVLLDSPCEHGDLLLGEMIRAVGGRTSVEGDQTVHELVEGDEIHEVERTPPYAEVNNPTKHSQRPVWRRMLTLIFKYPLALIGLGYLFGIQEPNANDYYKTKPDTLLIVVTLIATITFQGGLNPPGGFATHEDAESPDSGVQHAGQALVPDRLFIGADNVALLCSLIVILVLISPIPKYDVVIKILMWITWVSFFSMGFAFNEAIINLFPDSIYIFDPAWNVAMCVFSVWVCALFIVHWLKKGRWLKDERKISDARQDHKGGILLIRLIAGTMIILALGGLGTITYLIFQGMV